MVSPRQTLKTEHCLCAVDEIPKGKARGFLKVGLSDTVFAIRTSSAVYVYLNRCPHNQMPLDYMQDKFLAKDGSVIICYAHGAHFDIDSGVCTSGPCVGQRLVKVPSWIADGRLFVSLP